MELRPFHTVRNHLAWYLNKAADPFNNNSSVPTEYSTTILIFLLNGTKGALPRSSGRLPSGSAANPPLLTNQKAAADGGDLGANVWGHELLYQVRPDDSLGVSIFANAINERLPRSTGLVMKTPRL